MSQDVTTMVVEPLHLAAVRDRATRQNLSDKIMQHVGTVLQSLGKSQTRFGRCVVIYREEGGKECMLLTEAGVPIDVGWEVEPPFAADGPVAAVSTPAGMVATAVHIGPYDRVGEAHEAIMRWCRFNDRPVAGPNWEVYDHPREGQPPRTDVFYLIG